MTRICILLLACMLTVLALGTSLAEVKRWAVQGSTLRSGNHPGESVVEISVKDLANGSLFTLTSEMDATHIVETAIAHDKLIVVGKDNVDSAAIFDLEKRKLIDKLVGYGITLLGNRWIVYVEYYPNHVFGAFPSDVVLVYDLSLDPAQNRPYRPSVSETQWSLAQKAGIPVFPEANHADLSYDNIHERENETRLILRNTFCLVADRWLVFVGSTAGEYPAQRRYIVEVDLSKGPQNAPVLTKDFPTSLTETIKAGDNIQVTGIEAQGSNAVWVKLASGSYPDRGITISIP